MIYSLVLLCVAFSLSFAAAPERPTLSFVGQAGKTTVTVNKNDKIKLKCTPSTTGEAAVSYTWGLSGGPIEGYASHSAATLTIPAESKYTVGQISCRAKAADGTNSAPSSDIQINLVDLPTKPTINGFTASVGAKSAISWTCVKSGSVEVTLFQWFKGSTKLTSSGSTGETYSKSNVEAEDGGEYKCKALNGLQEFGTLSDPVTLAVTVPGKPTLSLVGFEETTVTLKEKDKIELKCTANAKGDTVAKYEWMLNKAKVPGFETHDSSTLKPPAELKYVGEYTCKGVNSGGAASEASNTITIKLPGNSGRASRPLSLAAVIMTLTAALLL